DGRGDEREERLRADPREHAAEPRRRDAPHEHEQLRRGGDPRRALDGSLCAEALAAGGDEVVRPAAEQPWGPCAEDDPEDGEGRGAREDGARPADAELGEPPHAAGAGPGGRTPGYRSDSVRTTRDGSLARCGGTSAGSLPSPGAAAYSGSHGNSVTLPSSRSTSFGSTRGTGRPASAASMAWSDPCRSHAFATSASISRVGGGIAYAGSGA